MVEDFVLAKIRENIITKDNLTKLVHLINSELLESAGRLEKQLEQTEKELVKISGKLSKLYVALESGKLEMDDLAPRIKELRACQHELQQQRDNLIARIESSEPVKLDPNEVMDYVNELEQVLGEKSFLQQKTFLRRFVKRMGFNPKGVVLDYTIPIPVGKNRTSAKEVLYIKQIGSGGWI
jgi:site-specific DNA recombinase